MVSVSWNMALNARIGCGECQCLISDTAQAFALWGWNHESPQREH